MDKANLLKRLAAIESYAESLLVEVREVLKHLDQAPSKPLRKRKNRKAEIEAEMEPYMRAQPYMVGIQAKFSLKVPPHYSRVLRY